MQHKRLVRFCAFAPVKTKTRQLGFPQEFDLLCDPFECTRAPSVPSIFNPEGFVDILRKVKDYIISCLPEIDTGAIWRSLQNHNISTERFKRAFQNTWDTARITSIRAVSSVKQFVTRIVNFILMYLGNEWQKFLDFVKTGVLRMLNHEAFTSLTVVKEGIAFAFILMLNIIALTSRNNTILRVCILAINIVLTMMVQTDQIKWATTILSVAQILLGGIDLLKTKPNAEFTPQMWEESEKRLVKDFGLNMIYIGVCAWCGLKDLPIPDDAKTITECLHRAGALGRAMTTWEKISTKLDVMFDQAFEIVFKLVLKQPYTSQRNIEAVDELYSEILEMTKLENQLKVGRDHDTSLRIELLYYKYLSLLKQFSTDHKARKTLESLSFIIHNLYGQVVDKNPKAHRMRAEPTVVLLTGKTGVGKTSMLHALQIDLLKICGKWNPTRGTDGLIYSRCSEQEYWDGYAGQPICVVDEFAQRIDSQQNPNLEFFELIRAANIFPYSLHSAALNEKANNSFKSDFMVLTSNIECIRAPSLYSTEAIERRIHLRFDVHVKPEVQTGIGSHPWKLSPQKLEQYRQNNQLPAHDMSHYVFTTGEGSNQTTTDYAGFLRAISLKHRDHASQFSSMSYATELKSDENLPPGVYSSDPRYNTFEPQMLPSGQDPEYDHVIYAISIVEFANLNRRSKMKFLQLGGRVYKAYTDINFHSVEDIASYCQENGHRFLEGYHEYSHLSLRNVMTQMTASHYQSFEEFVESNPEYGRYSVPPEPAGIRAPERPDNCVYENMGEYIYCNFEWKMNGFEHTGWKEKPGTTDEEVRYWMYLFQEESFARQGDMADKIREGGWPLFKALFTNWWWTMKNTRGYYNWKRVAEPILIAIGLIVMVYLGYDYVKKYTSKHISISAAASVIWGAYVIGTSNSTFMRGYASFSLVCHAVDFVTSFWKTGACGDHCHYCKQISEHTEMYNCANMAPFLRKLGKHRTSSEILDIIDLLKEKDFALLKEYLYGSKDHDDARFWKLVKEVEEEYDLLEKDEFFDSVDEPESNEGVESRKKKQQFESNEGIESQKKRLLFESNEGVESRKKRQIFESETKTRKQKFESNEGVESRKKKQQFESKKAALNIFKDVMKPEGVISKAADDLRGSLLRNLFQICIHAVDGDTAKVKELGHVFIIKGRKAIVNCHYLVAMREFMLQMKNCTFKIEIKQHNQESGHLMSFDEFFESLIHIKRGTTETELFMFSLPRSCGTGRDMSKHLVRVNELNKLTQGIRFLLCTKERVDKSFATVVRDGFFTEIRTVTLADYADKNLVHTYPNSLTYQMSTKPGDCGAPIIIGSDQFAHKIAGFHIGGAQGTGTGSIVTYGDIKHLIEDEMCEPDKVVFQPDGEDFPLRNGSFIYLGTIPKNMTTSPPLKSKLIQSPIFGQIAESKVKPALLRPALEAEGPMIKGLMKNAAPSFTLDRELLCSAVTSYKERIFRLPPLEQERKILNYKDSVRGIEGNPFFPPCKRSTSAGWPLCLEATKGKEKWLGEGVEWDFTSEEALKLRDMVAEMEEQCNENVIPEVYYLDTLKDEKRPIEKVEQGKTRVFSAAPLVFTILFRKYFLGFLAFMMRTKIANESAIGTNPYSNDWKSIVDNLCVFGDKSLIAGDFSNFDGTVNYYIMEEILHIINHFYSDGPKNKRIRRVLWQNVCKSKHILAHFVYQFAHSQPSGNPSTAVTNSMYNSIATRYCYAKIFGSAMSFNTHIRMIAYGDDNIISVHPKAKERFTPMALTEAFTSLGMIYTSETKSTSIDYFRNIGEVTFLKRGFSFDRKLRYWFSPLSVDSINEMTNWIRRSPNDWSALKENIEQCIVELYLHDFETFSNFTDKVDQICVKHYVQPVAFLDYHIARGMIATGRFHEINESAKNMRWAFTTTELSEEEASRIATFTPQSKENILTLREVIRENNLKAKPNLGRTHVFRQLRK